MCKALTLEKNVRFVGEVSDTDNLYGNYDLLILASRYEGFGLVIIESIFNATPVLVSRIDVTEELLGSNYPGFFSVGDTHQLSSLIEAAQNPEFREELLNLGQFATQRFSSARMFSSMSKVYKDALRTP
jgi:glycosyltransferase involved in cell wall biosynthesis